MRRIFLVFGLGLSGCTNGGLQSYVAPLSPEAGIKAASDITEFVSQQIKPGSGPIMIDAPKDDAVIAPVLTEDLKVAGFRFDFIHARHRVHYAVSSLDDSTLLRATVDGTAAARLYHVVGNTIEPSGPFTIAERDQ